MVAVGWNGTENDLKKKGVRYRGSRARVRRGQSRSKSLGGEVGEGEESSSAEGRGDGKNVRSAFKFKMEMSSGISVDSFYVLGQPGAARLQKHISRRVLEVIMQVK